MKAKYNLYQFLKALLFLGLLVMVISIRNDLNSDYGRLADLHKSQSIKQASSKYTIESIATFSQIDRDNFSKHVDELLILSGAAIILLTQLISGFKRKQLENKDE